MYVGRDEAEENDDRQMAEVTEGRWAALWKQHTFQGLYAVLRLVSSVVNSTEPEVQLQSSPLPIETLSGLVMTHFLVCEMDSLKPDAHNWKF